MAYPVSALVNVAPADLGALTNAAYRTWGLGAAATPFLITPQSTGRLLVIVSGDIVSGTTGAVCVVQLRQGTSGIATHDAADSGTAIGSQVSFTSLTGVLTCPFTLVAIITGLAVPSSNAGAVTAAVQAWLDVAVKASAGTIQLTSLDCVAIEI